MVASPTVDALMAEVQRLRAFEQAIRDALQQPTFPMIGIAVSYALRALDQAGGRP